MKTLLLFAFLIFTFSIVAQNKTDSLLVELGRHPQKDTIRYQLLKTLSYQYSFTNPVKGLIAADSAIALARQLNSNTRIAGAMTNKATNLHKLGRDSEAVALYLIAADLQLKAGNKKSAANVFYNLAYVYYEISNYFLSIKYQQSAIELYKEINLPVDEADSYNNIAGNYLRLNDYTTALKYYLMALNFYKKVKMPSNEAMVLSNIGMVYHELNDPGKAMQYYMQALEINKNSNDKNNLAHDYQHIGILNDETGNYQLAIKYFMDALNLNIELNNEREIASCYSNIAYTSVRTKDFVNALSSINNALLIYEKHTDKYNTALLLNTRGRMFIECSDSFLLQQKIPVDKRYDNALFHQHKALQLSREIKSRSLTVTILKDISRSYEKAKMYNKALIAYRQARDIQDSLLIEEQKKQITRLEMQNEFSAREAAIKTENDKKQLLSSQEISRQKLLNKILFITGGIILLAAAISFIFYKRKKEAETAKNESVLKTKILETEMKVLRTQMNPHFIFNSLNSIGDYILRNDIHSAEIYLKKFAAVMRLILENSENSSVALADDIKALKLYMDIERLRLNNKFNYEIIMDTSVDQENIMVPPLLLQPFVENSIWHGFQGKVGEGKINISLIVKDDMLVCTIEDNGIGRGRALQNSNGKDGVTTKSLGMKITDERVLMINKLKNSNASISIKDKEQGVCTEIKLPVEYNF